MKKNRAMTDRIHYGRIFPQQRTVNATNAFFLSYEELSRLLPDRVHLARVDDIFRSWSEAEAKVAPEERIVCDILKKERYHLTYEFDHYTYCSSMFYVHFLNRKPHYGIKLANDGFIYPSSSTLETDPSYDDSTTEALGGAGFPLALWKHTSGRSSTL